MTYTNIHLYALSTFFALPRILVLAALPSPLQSLIPVCAQSCLQDYLQQDFAPSICPDLSNFDCLCSNYGTDGYTLGERAFACLYSSSCSQTPPSNATSIYSVCSGKSDAATPTHKTVIVTATPSVTISSSTLDAGAATTTSSTYPTTSAAASTMSGATISAGPDGMRVSGSVSLTMAQIAGITIAAAALLILTVGIAACLIFVRKRNKRLEMEDRKVLLYDGTGMPESQGSQFVNGHRKDPRSGFGGVGIAPLHRYTPESHMQEEQRTWPRYYPVMPDELGIAAAISQPLSVPRDSPKQASELSQKYSPDLSNGKGAPANTLQGLQSTGTVLPPPPPPPPLPLPPAPVQVYPGKTSYVPISAQHNHQNRKSLRSTSSTTEFEKDSASHQPRGNFAGSPSQSGKSPRNRQDPPVNPAPVFLAPPSKKRRPSRPPPLTLNIPNTNTSEALPAPPQRPPLVRREEQMSKPEPRQNELQVSESQSQISNYSPLPSSQAMGGTTGIGSSAERSSSRTESNSRRPSRTSTRDSQASFTSFESLGSDDDPTPPQEEDRRLSPVHESPASNVKYPRVPRGSNQAVPRSPASPRDRDSEVSSVRSSPRTPQRNASGTPVIKQGIGNRLWKTEISPQETRPQYANWAPVTPPMGPNGQLRNQVAGIPGQQSTTSGSGMQQWEISMPPPFSPFEPMPKLTPTRRGEDLYLSVNR